MKLEIKGWKLLGTIITGILFWFAVDGIQESAPHALFDIFDGRSLWGFVALVCGYSTIHLGNQAVKFL